MISAIKTAATSTSNPILLTLNLTQHAATPEQFTAFVMALDTPEQTAEVAALLTVDELPSPEEVRARAWKLANIAQAWVHRHDLPVGTQVMIGGAPWLMTALARRLEALGLKPVFAFSKRESADQPQPDGSVRKVAVFRHVGFVDYID